MYVLPEIKLLIIKYATEQINKHCKKKKKNTKYKTAILR